MILNYDKDNGFSTFFNNFSSKVPEISSEVEKVFDNFQKLEEQGEVFDWDMFGQNSGFQDKNFNEWVSSLSDAEKATLSAGDALEQYQKYLNSTTKASSNFGSTLKTIGGTLASTFANAAISYGVSLLIQGLATGIYHIVKATEIAIEKGEKAQNVIKEVYDTYNSKVSTVNTNKNVFKHCTNCIKLIRLIECLIIL